MSERQGKQSSSHPESLIGHRLRDGEYTIQRVLSHGGMGKVYLATHTTLQTQLAIKQARADQPLPESVIGELDAILHSDHPPHHASAEQKSENDFPMSGGQHTDRFLREALLLARTEHFAIPSLYDYFAEDGYWYLVMDYVPGPTLSSYLREHAPLPPLEALNYTMQICDVLDYLHQQAPPVIFRDLKPSNIILAPDGMLMLIDFGIARYFKSGQCNDTTDFGSPGYASPEQYQGEGQTDARSDLYSLGVVLHEMLTGKHPKGSSTIFTSPRQVNPALSSALCGLVALATHAEPLYRIQSARAFYLALERVQAIEEGLAYRQVVDQLAQEEQSGIIASTTVPTDHVTTSETLDTHLDDSSTSVEYEPSCVPTRSQRFDQRHQIREALQQARHIQLEVAYTPHPATAIMERPEQKMPEAPVPWSYQSASTRWQLHQLPPQRKAARRNTPHTLQIILSLALLTALALTSLLLYQNYFVHRASLVTNHSQQSMPAKVAQPQDYSWQALPALPGPEADNAATYVQLQGRPYIYLIGGYRSQNNTFDYDRKLYRYDILAARWQIITPTYMPGTLNNALASDGQGNLFFTTGYSTDTYTIPSTLYSYQLATASLRKIVPPVQMPIGFGGSMLTDQQGHLYITQGFMRAGHPEALAGTGWYSYNTVSKQWQQLAALPQGLGYTQLAYDPAGSIFLFGGSSNAGQQEQSNRVYRYDIARNSWVLMRTTLPHPLSGAASCATRSDQLIVIGGYNSAQANTPLQVWLVDLHSMQWQALPVPPFGHAEMGTLSCDNNGNVFAERGADAKHHPTSDFWEMTTK